MTVKLQRIDLRVDAVSSALEVVSDDLESAEFTVRHYAAFTPEVGVGAVFGAVDRPQYGTAKNDAGATIVDRIPDDELSVEPSVLVNSVCRCGGELIAPMLQVGAPRPKTCRPFLSAVACVCSVWGKVTWQSEAV